MSQELKEVTIKSKQRLNSKGLNRYEIHITDKMLEEIEAIAISDGAKVHHISKKPIIRDTVINLLELGIRAIYEGVELPKKSNDANTDNDNRIDLTVLDERIEDKLKPLYSLISELSDKLNRIVNTDNNKGYSDNINNNTDNINRIDLTDNIEVTQDSQFYRIKNSLMEEFYFPEDLAKIFECSIEELETKEGLNKTQWALLSYLPKNDDGKYENRTYEILIDTEEDTLERVKKAIEVDITSKSTLSESPILPLNENSVVIVPDEDLTANNSDIQIVDTEKDTLDIALLLKKHKIPSVKDEPLVIKNNELLLPFFCELLGKKVDSKSLCNVANKDKRFTPPAILWTFLSVEKVKGKWQWTRIK
jgi:hypothetical protein